MTYVVRTLTKGDKILFNYHSTNLNMWLALMLVVCLHFLFTPFQPCLKVNLCKVKTIVPNFSFKPNISIKTFNLTIL